MAVPRTGKFAEPHQVWLSVQRTYRQTYGIKSAQLVTERVMYTKLLEDKQIFYNKKKLFYNCKNL